MAVSMAHRDAIISLMAEEFVITVGVVGVVSLVTGEPGGSEVVGHEGILLPKSMDLTSK